MKTTLPFRGDRRPKPYVNKPEISFTTSLILFILAFCFMFAAKAQEYPVQRTPVAKAVSSENKEEITPLKIGDKIPDELWDMYFPVISSASEQEQYLSLGDFKDKLIILDFWATWCSSCIPSMNKLNELHVALKENLLVVPITSQPKDKVIPTLKAKGWSFSSVYDDDFLNKAFPHLSLPYQVWIYKGKVFSTPVAAYATKENIQAVLSGKTVDLVENVERVDFNKDEQFFNVNGSPETTILWSRGFTSYIPGLSSSMNRPTKYSIHFYNVAPIELYKAAFADEFEYFERFNNLQFNLQEQLLHKVILPPSMEFKGVFDADVKFLNWRQNNVYCYSASFSPSITNKKANELFREDLNAFFGNHLGITGKVKIIERKSLVLVHANHQGKPPSRGSVVDDKRVDKITYREFLYKFLVANRLSDVPIINEVGEGKGKLIYPLTDYTNLVEVTSQLQAIGMDLIEEVRAVKTLVFSELNEQ